MKNLFRNNLFIKICLSFWVTTLFMIGAVLTVDWLTDTGPFRTPKPFMPGPPFPAYGQTLVWILEHEGRASLNAFARRIQKETGFQVSLADENGVALIDRPEQTDFKTRTGISVKVGNNGGEPWREEGRAALRVIGPTGKAYTMTVHAPLKPPPPPGENQPWGMILFRLLVVLAVSGFICYLLARYLTAPILKLGAAVRQMATGDLSVRISHALGNRKDEIARLALDFDRMAERIESLVNNKRILLRDISHELRSPLARLNVALELCRKESDTIHEKALHRIERESAKLNELIESLLILNRVESGISTTQPTTIDLAKLIQERVDDADFEAKSLNRGVKTTNMETCFTEGYEDLLCRAIDNVARNAVRYTADGTIVEVALRRCEKNGAGTGVITIRDHGQGVPEELLPCLFQAFYRVGEGRERETGGTGLGLAITEAAIRLHGGQVHAANADGGGLIVEISLPVLSKKE